MNERKPIKERLEAYNNMPKQIRDSFSEKEKESFLYDEVCPDSIFEKLQEFAIED